MTKLVKILIDTELKESYGGISLAYLTIDSIANYDLTALDELIKETLEYVRSTFKMTELGKQPIIRAYRDFYWHKLKIDPTKQRPAAEALLRRILRGNPLPRIHPLVDLCNVLQLKTLLCIGIYDIDKIKEELVLRKARPGEMFYPIGSPPKALKGKEIVLSDEEKLLHVFPHRDSILTAISNETKRALMVLCGVPGVSLPYLRKSLKEVKSILKRIITCSLGSEQIISV